VREQRDKQSERAFARRSRVKAFSDAQRNIGAKHENGQLVMSDIGGLSTFPNKRMGSLTEVCRSATHRGCKFVPYPVFREAVGAGTLSNLIRNGRIKSNCDKLLHFSRLQLQFY
jgi:hypothetical protein